MIGRLVPLLCRSSCRALLSATVRPPVARCCTSVFSAPGSQWGAGTQGRRLCSDGRAGDQKEEMSLDEELKQLSLLQRYKKLAKEYWYVLIPVHCCTSIFWFGSCLAVVYTGVDVDLVYIAEWLHLPEGLVKPLRNPNLGKLAVALMLYKLVSPLRYMSTVYMAMPSIKYLVRRGLIKPVPRLTSKKKIEEEISRIKNKMTKKRGED